MASVQYLKDLRQQCKERGLDSGLKATDLILIYFCDQNSDACERLFTDRVADLLDTYVPGSQGTSLYIRSVFHLIEPFRKPNFGSPSDVQQSVLWHYYFAFVEKGRGASETSSSFETWR